MTRLRILTGVLVCILLLTSAGEAKYKVEVGDVPGVFGGQFATIPIYINAVNPEVEQSYLGGFTLTLSYFEGALIFTGAQPGSFMDYCDWEFFSYRWETGSYTPCCDNCPSVKVFRITALANQASGSYPGCFRPDSEHDVLATISVLASSDINMAGRNFPVDFYWIPGQECSANSFSDQTGETLILADNVYNYLNQPFNEAFNCSGPDASCFGDKIIPRIDFYSGYVHILEREYVDDRGDINLDGNFYQIADAVTFTNYFIQGLSAFTINIPRQVAATEINCDGITLTVADLVYLIRIIVGDALPIWDCNTGYKSLSSGGSFALEEASVNDTMAFLGTVGYAGQNSCPFEIYAANSVDLGGLQARIEFDPAILTPSLDESIGDGQSVEFELLGRAVGFDDPGVVQVFSREPGVLLIYMYPDWGDFESSIPAGSGPILAVNFDVHEDINLYDSSLFAFVSEGHEYNMFATILGQAIFPTLVDGYFVGYTDLMAFYGAQGWAGQQNIPFEFFVVNTDSVGEVIMDITYNPAYINPSLVVNGDYLPWGVGQEVEFQLMGRAIGFEDEGTSGVLVGTPATGQLRIWFRPWSDIWGDVTTIGPGVGPIIKVFFDVNPPPLPLRPSPVAFNPGGYNYFRFWDAEQLWPTTVNGTFTVIRKPEPPSCPVLFSFDGHNFVQDNPLLTACENSNYVNTVTDYYLVMTPVFADNGRVKFQIREMEDEITYLEEVSLITVDHSSDTRVACAVDGSIYAYRDVREPLTAVDHRGTNCLEAVRTRDDNLYLCNESGYMILTFPGCNGKEIGYNLSTGLKPLCPEPIDSFILPKSVPIIDDNRQAASVKVEFLDESGNWSGFSEIPSRDKITYQFVTGEPGVNVNTGVVTMRISWEGSYATDVINQFIVANEIPEIKNWAVSDYRLNNPVSAAKGYIAGQTLTLTKGETFEFSFNCGLPADNNNTRDYIIRAVGRYQPDYSVYSHLVPGGFQLYDNYPNPFNPTTTISYDLPEATHVKLEIFNLLGQHITTLVDEIQSPGHRQVEWNSTDRQGQTVASGIYLYRFTAGNFMQSKKMLLLK